MNNLGFDKAKRVYHAIARCRGGIYLGDRPTIVMNKRTIITETGISPKEIRAILVFLEHVKAIEKRDHRYYVKT